MRPADDDQEDVQFDVRDRILQLEQQNEILLARNAELVGICENGDRVWHGAVLEHHQMVEEMTRVHGDLLNRLTEKEEACGRHLQIIEGNTARVKLLEDIAEDRLQYMENRNSDLIVSTRQLRNEKDRVRDLEAQILSRNTSMSTMQSGIFEMAMQLESIDFESLGWGIGKSSRRSFPGWPSTCNGCSKKSSKAVFGWNVISALRQLDRRRNSPAEDAAGER